LNPQYQYPSNQVDRLPWWIHAPLGIAAILASGFAFWVSRPPAAPPLPKLPSTTLAVVKGGAATISLLPLQGGNPARTITVPGSPNAIVVATDGSKAFLLDTNHGVVVPVDLVNGRSLAAVPVGKLPVDEHLSLDGKLLFVTDNLSAAVIPIDTATYKPQSAQGLSSGVDGYFPWSNGFAAVTIYTASGAPGLLYFSSPTAGLGPPIRAGTNPITDLHFSPDGKTAWLLESGIGNSPGQLIPVDVASGAVGSSLLVGHGPNPGAITKNGRLMIIPNGLDGTVSILDLIQRLVVATVAVGSLPETPTITYDDGTAWVPCQLDKTLVPVSLTTYQIGQPLNLDKPPTAASTTSENGAWVMFSSSNGTASVLDNSSRSFGSAIPVGNGPSMVISADAKTAWVANSLSDSVQQVDLVSGHSGTPIPVAKAPSEMALIQQNGRLLVLSFGDGSHSGFLTAIDGTSQANSAALQVGPSPSSLTVTPDGKTAFIAIHQNNQISVVDLSKFSVGNPIALPCSPTALQITPDGKILYAACANSALVIPIDTTSMAPQGAINVPANPTLVMGNLGKFLYVLGAHDIRAIDTSSNQVVAAQRQSNNIVSLQSMPDDRSLLAIDNTGGSLLLLDGATLKTTKSLFLTQRPDVLRLSRDGKLAFVLDTTKQRFYVVQTALWAVSATIDVSPNAQDIAVPQRR
jgi:sugar lactone lactonase YvrE